MIPPERFYNHLVARGIDFFTGVPDSLMKHFLQYLHTNVEPKRHIIAANEGLAVALAAGYYFSTGRLPLVYLQNSGLGNTINPLTSLADKEMFGVPMLLLIGWRGEPGEKDEPQHKKMGRITQQILETLEIPFFILEQEEVASLELVNKAIETAVIAQQPVALLVKKGLFEPAKNSFTENAYELSREYVLEHLMNVFSGQETVVCTTGETGRSFYEINRRQGHLIKKELLSVGAMGLAAHIALGIDLWQDERVVMLDGDGALLMHLGSLPATGKLTKKSFVHIVFNNGCHASVGGQPTLGFDIDFCTIAKACGYTTTFRIENKQSLQLWLDQSFNTQERQFVEIRINTAVSDHLPRPSGEPADWKNTLMSAMGSRENC